MTPQQANGILKLAMQMAGNPKTREKFFNTAREADPTIRIPPDVQLAQFKREHVREKEEDKIRTAAEKAQEQQAAARKRLEKKYTEEQIAEIEAVAQKYGISDYDAAAKVYGADLKPAKADSRPRKSSTWDLPEFDRFAKDPSRAAQDAAYDLIDRFNAGERIA
jgi:lipopolysaccharide export LptBFGC system permease protein LptF